jgi:hypothetical protein
VSMRWARRVFSHLPGPLMVPLFAAVGQRLSRHLSMSWIVALGNPLVGRGAALMAMSARGDVDYWTQLFPGWLIIGAGVVFALPNLPVSLTPSVSAGINGQCDRQHQPAVRRGPTAAIDSHDCGRKPSGTGRV